jgi:hypothetical protein
MTASSNDQSAAFATPLKLSGPPRQPRQMLDNQSYGGHASVHDAAIAGKLGLSGAPIEGPTHFSQFDPLAFERFGVTWFERGCVSAHFSTMVVEGEEVSASLDLATAASGRIEATKLDGSVVLVGTASIDHESTTEIDSRLARLNDPGELFILDQLVVQQRSSAPTIASVDFDTSNGALYPFSLRQKLDALTEPSTWYSSGDNPWDRPILPFEMISVLAQKTGNDFPVRGPAVGLFLDLEIRLNQGPVFVNEEYVLEREVVGLSQSRRTESYWVKTTLTSAATDQLAATVILHSGVFKASFGGYPVDRLH